jgi:hypothetical protein
MWKAIAGDLSVDGDGPAAVMERLHRRGTGRTAAGRPPGRCRGGGAAVRGHALADVDADLLEGFLAPARATMTPAEWDAEYGAGRALSQDQAAALLLTLEQ